MHNVTFKNQLKIDNFILYSDEDVKEDKEALPLLFEVLSSFYERQEQNFNFEAIKSIKSPLIIEFRGKEQNVKIEFSSEKKGLFLLKDLKESANNLLKSDVKEVNEVEVKEVSEDGKEAELNSEQKNLMSNLKQEFKNLSGSKKEAEDYNYYLLSDEDFEKYERENSLNKL